MLRRVQDGLALVLVELRLEERAVDGLVKERGRDALRFGIDESLGKRLNHGGDHEVAAEFERVRLPGLAGDDSEAAADRLEYRADLGEPLACAPAHDPQLAGFCHRGTAEDRRSHVMLPALLVCSGDAAPQADA